MNTAETKARLDAAKYIVPRGYTVVEDARIKTTVVQTRTSVHLIADHRSSDAFKASMQGYHADAICAQLAEVCEPKYVGQDKNNGDLLWETRIQVLV
jgi:hypothetical protein